MEDKQGKDESANGAELNIGGIVNRGKELVGNVGGFIATTQDDLNELVKRAAENHNAVAARKVFDKLFTIIQPSGGDNENQDKFWLDRSKTWVDCMLPEGRRWLDMCMPTSYLPRDVDFSWAFEENIILDEEQEHQIEIDLPRTFPGIDYFQDDSVVNSFRAVLRAVALTLPEVGYVQGMNFIVAYILLHTKTEKDAHRLTVEMLSNPKYNLRGVFVEGLPSLKKLSSVLQLVVKDKLPEMHAHFVNVGFEDLFFSYQWISTLFAYTMPFDALCHVWEIFFEKGWPGFFAVSLTLIEDNKDALLKQDFDEACATMKTAVLNPREDFYIRARSVEFTKEEIDVIQKASTF
mmetsp:Transcript_19955/g.32890  ORF Transcript_19955/g.32890 Transcript_19955/m.32890 type:complete len:349 (-) Transcript_19955:882-1928(-)